MSLKPHDATTLRLYAGNDHTCASLHIDTSAASVSCPSRKSSGQLQRPQAAGLGRLVQGCWWVLDFCLVDEFEFLSFFVEAVDVEEARRIRSRDGDDEIFGGSDNQEVPRHLDLQREQLAMTCCTFVVF